MSRSKWKGSNVKKNILKNFFFASNNDCIDKKIWSRSNTILENFIGKVLLVHNGKIFKKIFISREKIGFKLGVFCHTRKHNLSVKILNKKKNK